MYLSVKKFNCASTGSHDTNKGYANVCCQSNHNLSMHLQTKLYQPFKSWLCTSLSRNLIAQTKELRQASMAVKQSQSCHNLFLTKLFLYFRKGNKDLARVPFLVYATNMEIHLNRFSIFFHKNSLVCISRFVLGAFFRAYA